MRNYMEAGWFYSGHQIRRYFSTRLTSLRPPRAALKNPWEIVRELDGHQWAMFGVSFAAWTWDAFDFFTVGLCVTEIAEDFGELPSAITWGITITLMLRSVGALISGSIGDRYGRKWIMIANLSLFIILELCSGFCNTLPQLLGVRALYGICMGGLLGPAVATALEDLPYDARGILGALFHQGYAFGYILAALFYRAFVPTYGWRSLFWFGAGPPILIIAWRLYLPETNSFQVLKAAREDEYEKGVRTGSRFSGLRAFLDEANKTFRDNWVLFVFMVMLMTAFNCLTHGGDLYPTFLKIQAEAGPTQVTIVTFIGQVGSILGSTTAGWFSTFAGRRLTMMVCCVMGGALVAPYVLLRGDRLIAVTFFQHLLGGGVWGPVPVYLVELSPYALRTFFYGVTYQLGNLASAASATIEAKIGEKFPLPPSPDGKKRFDYGKVIGIYMGISFVAIMILVFLGPEMTQKERDEEASVVLRLEEVRVNGRSLRETGRRGKTTAGDTASSSGNEEGMAEKRVRVGKSETAAARIEDV
ncbi:unnamed protein product [Zymoseptoria tritici ST99CH_3D1]|nr:unnamed protein product [Zymoseptoria tritici ST99CH_3D1]